MERKKCDSQEAVCSIPGFLLVDSYSLGWNLRKQSMNNSKLILKSSDIIWILSVTSPSHSFNAITLSIIGDEKMAR